jgi:hypothetical protein
VRWSWNGDILQLKVAMMVSYKLTMSVEWRQWSKLWLNIFAMCPLPRVYIWQWGYCKRENFWVHKIRCLLHNLKDCISNYRNNKIRCLLHNLKDCILIIKIIKLRCLFGNMPNYTSKIWNNWTLIHITSETLKPCMFS